MADDPGASIDGVDETEGDTTPDAAEESDESEEGDTTPAEKSDAEILEEARKRFKLAEDAESDIRAKALEVLKFRTGEQWDPEVKAARILDRRPCLTINRLPQHVQQVTNDQRQNRPSLKVHPVDDQADIETAKIIQGLFRHIEYNSSADSAYDTAFEGTVGEGLGYFRVLTEYADPMSFDQEILIKRIRDRFSVFFDPYSQEPDGSDALFAFIIEDLSPDEFRTRYPKAKLSGPGQWEAMGTQSPDWVRGDSARIAEYFYKEFAEKEIALLSDGRSVLVEELPKYLTAEVTLVRKRTASVPVIKWCKINGCEILDKTILPGYWIPVIPVYGTEHVIEGKRILKGIATDAMDSQRVYNVMKSAEMEAIGLAPKAPFVMAFGQVEGFEALWNTANTRNHPYLPYNPKSVDGTQVPPPQRMSFEPAVMAITQAAMGAGEDIKNTTGIFDASRGAPSNETSGIAIQRRNQQAQTSNFHFVDNLTRSMKHLGRILIKWCPVYYDGERTTRIIGDDGTAKTVKLNAPFQENGKTVLGDDGQPLIYRLDVGKYDVTVDVGPSYASKRQEAAASMIELTKSMPAIGQSAPDLIVKSMDVPGAQELAERLKKTLPPGLADDPKDGQPQVPPQMQAQMQHMGQMVEQLTKQLHQAHDAIDKDLVQTESKERIEFAKIRSNEAIALAQIDAKDSIALLSAEIESTKHRLDLLGIGQPIENESQEPEAAPGAPQEQAPGPDAGAPQMGAAEPQPPEQGPTGGQSPIQPMEGPNVDPGR